MISLSSMILKRGPSSFTQETFILRVYRKETAFDDEKLMFVANTCFPSNIITVAPCLDIQFLSDSSTELTVLFVRTAVSRLICNSLFLLL
jgi:hypothetical protein